MSAPLYFFVSVLTYLVPQRERLSLDVRGFLKRRYLIRLLPETLSITKNKKKIP